MYGIWLFRLLNNKSSHMINIILRPCLLGNRNIIWIQHILSSKTCWWQLVKLHSLYVDQQKSDYVSCRKFQILFDCIFISQNKHKVNWKKRLKHFGWIWLIDSTILVFNTLTCLTKTSNLTFIFNTYFRWM